MLSKQEIAKQFTRHKSEAQRGLGDQHDNTRKCQAAYAGDVCNYTDKIQFVTLEGRKKRAVVQINRVKPFVNSVKGFMAQNRRRPKYIARIMGSKAQEMFSRYANSLSDYTRENANADQVETQADGGMLVQGYSGIETAMTYTQGYATTDPNGEIVMGELDPLSLWWDPAARKTNLLDAGYTFYQKKFPLKEAMELFDDGNENHFEGSNDEDIEKGSGYKFYQGGGRYDRIKQLGGVDWAEKNNDIVNVFFYQWMELEPFFRCDNPVYTLTNPQAVQLAFMQLEQIKQEMVAAGEEEDLFNFDPKAKILTFDEKTKTKLLEIFGKYITAYEYKRKVFYTAPISGKYVFKAFKNVCQQGFSIKFKTGDWDANKKIWVGMVNSMIEPQEYYNKSLTELMFIIGATSKGGIMAEEDTIEDIADFEAKYAKTDSVVIVQRNALMEGRIKPKREADMPTGYEKIVQLCDANINAVTGIDPTFLGSSESKDETGILQKRRIRQVVSTLACFFDSITLYAKEHARLMLDFLRVYAENNDGSMFRILGDDGRDEFVQISKDKLAAEYDVTIQEAPQTPEDKQELAALLGQMADKLLAVGDSASAKAIYAVALKGLPLDRADLNQIMQILMPQGQNTDPAYVAQLEQQVQQLMNEITQADVVKKQSEAAKNMASVQKTGDEIRKMTAETAKTLAEAEQVKLENTLVKSVPALPVDGAEVRA